MHSQEDRENSNIFQSLPHDRLFWRFSSGLEKEELFKDGTRVKLQGKVYQALLALLQKPGEIVYAEELRMQLWPADTHVNYDAKRKHHGKQAPPDPLGFAGPARLRRNDSAQRL